MSIHVIHRCARNKPCFHEWNFKLCIEKKIKSIERSSDSRCILIKTLTYKPPVFSRTITTYRLSSFTPKLSDKCTVTSAESEAVQIDYIIDTPLWNIVCFDVHCCMYVEY